MEPQKDPHTLDDDPDKSLSMMRSMQGDINALRSALKVEVARSDFLWDRAYARGLVTEEEYAIAQNPESLERK